jgi:hypothetical protein
VAAIYRAGKLLVLIIGVLAALALYIGLQMYTPALPRYGKGGVGIIAKNTYVLTRGARNIIQRYDSMIWAGDSVKTQTAFVPLQLVHFRPGQIYFFDFKTFRGGNYLRDIASLPPQMTKVLNEADRFILLSLFPNQPRDSTPRHQCHGTNHFTITPFSAKLSCEINRSARHCFGIFTKAFQIRTDH